MEKWLPSNRRRVQRYALVGSWRLLRHHPSTNTCSRSTLACKLLSNGFLAIQMLQALLWMAQFWCQCQYHKFIGDQTFFSVGQRLTRDWTTLREAILFLVISSSAALLKSLSAALERLSIVPSRKILSISSSSISDLAWELAAAHEFEVSTMVSLSSQGICHDRIRTQKDKQMIQCLTDSLQGVVQSLTASKLVETTKMCGWGWSAIREVMGRKQQVCHVAGCFVKRGKAISCAIRNEGKPNEQVVTISL